MTYLEKWDYLYSVLGIRDFIYFISSEAIQQQLFGIKLVFIFFAVTFLIAIIYFYLNSSYLQQQFVQDASEFLSWQPYALRQINKRWTQIIKKTEMGNESDFKLAIIEADDLLYQVLEELDFQGETFEEALSLASQRVANYQDIVYVHTIRNSIVYNSDYVLDLEEARRILAIYEQAIKALASS